MIEDVLAQVVLAAHRDAIANKTATDDERRAYFYLWGASVWHTKDWLPGLWEAELVARLLAATASAPTPTRAK